MNRYNIQDHTLLIIRHDSVAEIWKLENGQRTGLVDTHYIGPNEDGIKIWRNGDDLLVERCPQKSNPEVFDLELLHFILNSDGGILTIDIRNPAREIHASFPLTSDDPDIFLILRFNHQQELELYYSEGA